MFEYEESAGELRSVYDELIAKRGKLSEVLKIQILHPASIKAHTDFYLEVMFAKTALTRGEKELIAVVVSVANGCLYCQTHHGAALNACWKDEERVSRLKLDYRSAVLSEKDLALCAFAEHLTRHPAEHYSPAETWRWRKGVFEDHAQLRTNKSFHRSLLPGLEK